MNFHALKPSSECRIPVERIVEARAAFPGCALSFEVEFEAVDLTALADLAVVISRTGLVCECLRYRRSGTVLALLRDSTDANFELMQTALDRSVAPVTVRWTIVLSKHLN